LNFYNFSGVKFIDGSFSEIMSELDSGGLMVVPAAPALATINEDAEYHLALQFSDIAIFDSGYFCMLLYFFKGIKVKKISGLEFIREFLAALVRGEKNQVYLVDPNQDDAKLNKKLFEKYDIPIIGNQYVSPQYQKNLVIDEELLKDIKLKRPKYIVINLGGGVQELLGAYLKKNIEGPYKPIIICTGAAVAFLTGSQTHIPKFMDYLYLGWLARCISDPKRFIPRYIGGFKLIKIVVNTKMERVG